MAARRIKIKKTLVLSVLILITGGFFINWYLNHRLEQLLHEEISKRVSEATGGFYHLSYEKLSIGLFSGELNIEGLDMRPDTLMFHRLSKTDSLPEVYFKINIGSIDFKGINLTWTWNYRRLHFDLFEIKSPTIELFSLYALNPTEEEKSDQSLYEMVSPYFDIITVNHLSLQNTKLSYSVADGTVPAVYALWDAGFNAYSFRLDENSYKSGKLLYCDNFEFTTNRPQTLFQDEQMILNTGNINLNTADSTIRIQGIELLPRQGLWKETDDYPSGFVEAKVNGVEIKGVSFRRESAKRFLNARLFTIYDSDITYYKTDTTQSGEIRWVIQADRQRASHEWSLYDILSPVLSSTSIKHIDIDRTTLRYIQVTKDGNDEYLLNNLDFWADGFLVDAKSSLDPSLLYSSAFGFVADSLVGYMPSRNHNINIKRVLLDTDKGILNINKAHIEPISTTERYDYISGTIDSINITGLNTAKGLNAEHLVISSPRVAYTRNVRGIAKKEASNENGEDSDDEEYEPTERTSIDMLAGITGHYYIKDIELNNAYLVYKNQNHKQGKTDIFRMNDFNFFARDFLVNNYTRENIDWYFDCSDFGFNLKNFDNYINKGIYRLSAKDILFTGLNGKLSLKDIKLIPQPDKWNKAPDTYFRFISPSAEATGLNFKNQHITFRNLSIKSPQLLMVNERAPLTAKKKGKQKKISFSIDAVDNIFGEIISIDDIEFELVDKIRNRHLLTNFDKLDIKSPAWNLSGLKTLKIKDIHINKPTFGFTLLADKQKNTGTANAGKNAESVKSELFEIIDVDNFLASGITLNTNIKGDKSSLDMDAFNLKQLHWKLNGNNSVFGLGEIALSNPSVNMFIGYHPEDTLSKRTSTARRNIYETLRSFSSKISIGKFNLANANIDYTYATKGIGEKNRKLNDVNLDFEDLMVDNLNKKIKLKDISFTTDNLSLPVDNGFYTLNIGRIALTKRGEKLQLDDINLTSHYPKMEFAYRHPHHSDWFGFSLQNFTARGIDIPKFFSDNILEINDVQVNDVALKNFKNQKIITPQRIMPMVYEQIQKAPFKFDVANMAVNNMYVEYEELAKNGEFPGKIFFTEMNGLFSGFTNIVKKPRQYIRLEADGKLMGTGYFTATWKIPVDSLNDRFILRAHLHEFDLQELNQLIEPLAKANIVSGVSQNTLFNMDASSAGGWIGMSFLYDRLKVNIMKKKDGELSENMFMTDLANLIVRSNNPNNRKAVARNADFYVKRDPYHSTFNYFWQMLHPALVESVGVPHRTLKFIKSIPEIPEKLRNFFWKEGSYDGQKEEQAK